MSNILNGAEEPDENKDELPVPQVWITSNLGDIKFSSTGAIFTNTINASTITVSPTLFGQWIEKTKYLQEEFYGQKFEDFTLEQLVEWVRINVLAAEDELHEALGEISWKPWASSTYFNREAYLGEIVDVLHFIGNLLAGAGITDRELNTAYLAKMERNRQRQREGYTGMNKCAGCKRAVDDIEAHGGKMVQGDETGQWCDSCVAGPPVEDDKE